MDSCSTALFLSLRYLLRRTFDMKIAIPKHTYISVPAAILHAGQKIEWTNEEWTGAYRLKPLPIIDSALRMKQGMYEPGTLYCISFHARKHIKIGRGGAVLTDDTVAANWLRRARFDGRTGSVPFMSDMVEEAGWNAYMTPEQAARGLQLLEAHDPNAPDLTPAYPDLSLLPAFKGA
jgi:dTDP-4-amino-4,6-dideoxygalactose transaminase